MTGTYKTRGFISGFRFAGTESFLRDSSYIYGVWVDIEVHNRWLRQDIEYTVTGDKERVDLYMKEIEQAIERYNKK